MSQSRGCEQRLRELIDADLSAEELGRLARVDAMLRVAAGHVVDRDEAPSFLPRANFHDGAPQNVLDRPLAVPSEGGIASPSHKRRTRGEAIRPSLRLVTTRPAATRSTPHRADEQTHELKLTFGELALIYKSLQAVKTLGALPPQDELLNDTIHLVDLALKKAV